MADTQLTQPIYPPCRVSPHDGSSARAKAAADNSAEQAGAAERPLIGHDAELALILNKAAGIISGVSSGGAVVLEGSTGMGKTKLLNEVRCTHTP